MLKPISKIIKDSIGNIIYRGNVVTGIVETDNGDGSYDVFISESDKAYPKIFTLSANPNLAVGDKVRILYKDGCKELPIILPPAVSVILFESYLAPNATVFPTFYGNNWRGQVFLTTSAHTVNYIELLLARRYAISAPGTIYVEIKKVDGSNLPIGAILTSGTTDGNTLIAYASAVPPDITREWRRIDLTEYNLENATKYAITLHLIGGDATHRAGIWNHHNADPGDSYGDGGLVSSTTGGASWSYAWFQDGGFKIYGKSL